MKNNTHKLTNSFNTYRGKPRYFTYVITEEGMKFSETGAEFSKDIMFDFL